MNAPTCPQSEVLETLWSSVTYLTIPDVRGITKEALEGQTDTDSRALAALIGIVDNDDDAVEVLVETAPHLSGRLGDGLAPF